MMEDNDLNEKLSIRNSTRSLKKYGSTSSHKICNEVLIKHVVTTTDTLQGIALKYGVTTEQIRRANRLFATDSLFLRKYLMIPVESNSPFAQKSGEASKFQTDASASESADNLVEQTIDEFLGQIDSSIAIAKNEVRKAQGNSVFTNSDTFDWQSMSNRSCGRKPVISRMKLSTNNNVPAVVVDKIGKVGTVSGNSNRCSIIPTPPSSHNDTIIMTGGRKVRTSLQKLAQQQDEIFEL